MRASKSLVELPSTRPTFPRPSPDVEGLSALRSTTSRHCDPASISRALGIDMLVLAALLGGALLLGLLIHGRHAVAHEAVTVLAFAAGVAAAILLAAVAGLTGSGRTGRLAGAVALYAGVALLVRAAGLEDPLNIWVLASSAAVLGALGMLVLGVRGPVTGSAGRWAAGLVGGLTVAAVAAIAAVAVALPGWMPPAWAVGTLDVVAWSGAGAAGMVALVAGARSGRALLRRTGMAFATLSGAHAARIVTGGAPGADQGAAGAALELAAVGMLLVAAVAFFVAVLRGVRRPVPAAPRPAVADIPRARSAERPDERWGSASPTMLDGATVGPITDGIRLLTPLRTPLAEPPAADDHVPGTARPRAHIRGTRRPRPDRGRPPGRRGRD